MSKVRHQGSMSMWVGIALQRPQRPPPLPFLAGRPPTVPPPTAFQNGAPQRGCTQFRSSGHLFLRTAKPDPLPALTLTAIKLLRMFLASVLGAFFACVGVHVPLLGVVVGLRAIRVSGMAGSHIFPIFRRMTFDAVAC